jgi:OOP family OmpA-OmpF porin
MDKRGCNFVSAILALLVLAAGSATAQESITVSMGSTYNTFDDERGLGNDTKPFGAYAVDLRINERWAAELWYKDGNSVPDAGGSIVDFERWQLDAVYYFEPSGSLHPYLAVGAGWLEGDPRGPAFRITDDLFDDTDEELNFGGGVHWFFTDNFSLRGDARYMFGFEDSTSNFSFTLGISYRFRLSRP